MPSKEDMLILALIGAVWSVSCTMAVSLCVMARRADAYLEEAHEASFAVVSAPAGELSVPFVATFAEPDPVPAVAPQAAPAAAQQRAAV